MSIAHFNKKQVESHCEKLERMYLSAPCNAYWDPGVRISEGEAEILIPVQERFLRTPGAIHESVYFAAIGDAAALAVNSVTAKSLVAPASFHVHFPDPCVTGELIARGHFVGMSGDQYLAEAILTDPAGNELGRGSGVFAESRITLSAEIGYQ